MARFLGCGVVNTSFDDPVDEMDSGVRETLFLYNVFPPWKLSADSNPPRSGNTGWNKGPLGIIRHPGVDATAPTD